MDLNNSIFDCKIEKFNSKEVKEVRILIDNKTLFILSVESTDRGKIHLDT
jgi:hypothetical protein